MAEEKLIVYDLLVDYDGTTRSHFTSAGLFTSEEKAWAYGSKLINVYGSIRVEEREVL